MQNLFITFEGTEGCGKTTQVELLFSHLRQIGVAAVLTREPGGSPIGGPIRKLLLSEEYSPAPITELLLYGAERAQHVQDVIRPALKSRKWVLCDRYGDATRAYQAFGRGLPRENIEKIQTIATGGLEPDLTFLFDLPVEKGLDRARARNGACSSREGRFESEVLDFHQRVADGYAALAREYPDRIVVIDASGSREEVFAGLLKELEERVEFF